MTNSATLARIAPTLLALACHGAAIKPWIDAAIAKYKPWQTQPTLRRSVASIVPGWRVTGFGRDFEIPILQAMR